MTNTPPSKTSGSLDPRPAPSELWEKARQEFPDDALKRGERYRELMRWHGHLIPKANLDDDGSLPCGWKP